MRTRRITLVLAAVALTGCGASVHSTAAPEPANPATVILRQAGAGPVSSDTDPEGIWGTGPGQDCSRLVSGPYGSGLIVSVCVAPTETSYLAAQNAIPGGDPSSPGKVSVPGKLAVIEITATSGGDQSVATFDAAQDIAFRVHGEVGD